MEALLSLETLRAIHHEVLLPENVAGERDGRLEGVYGRIEARVYYLAVNDVFDVAAIFGTYIAVAHPFNDGNKRTAFACIDLILAAAGAALTFTETPDEDPLFELVIQCGQGTVDEVQLANYLRGRYMNLNSADRT
jgi:death on curing protein